MATLTASRRLVSLDALRGFDMLLIAGGGEFIYRMKGKTPFAWVDWMANQLEHPAWHGFTFYDFIFPLFLFLAGISLSFSLTLAQQRGVSEAVLLRKVFKRFLILFFLGILDKNAPTDFFDPAHIRYGTVLGRIGLATLVVAWLYFNTTWRQQLLIAFGTLVFYFALLMLVPAPGYTAGDLTFEGNLVGWFDRTFMPGKLKQDTYDELALLTSLPAICLTLLGALVGDWLRTGRTDAQKLSMLLMWGAGGIALGMLWNLVFPINKHLWSSSFIVLTAGMSCWMVALFYWLIEVKQWRRWAFFFQVIGTNSLVIYMLCRFVDFGHTSELLFGGIYGHAPEPWHNVFNALGGVLLVWMVLYVMFRHKIFVKF